LNSILFSVCKVKFLKAVIVKSCRQSVNSPLVGWLVGLGASARKQLFANFGRVSACAICKCAVLCVGIFHFSILSLCSKLPAVLFSYTWR